MIGRGAGETCRTWASALLMTAISAAGALPARGDECPRRFDEATTGLPSACVFVGRYNPHCGEEAVAVFAGDGTALVVSLSASSTSAPLFIAADVLSATEGKLVFWHPDLQLRDEQSAGSVRLEDGGQQLRLRVAGGELSAAGCPFEEFVGRFAGMAAAAPPVQAAVQVRPIAVAQ